MIGYHEVEVLGGIFGIIILMIVSFLGGIYVSKAK